MEESAEQYTRRFQVGNEISTTNSFMALVENDEEYRVPETQSAEQEASRPRTLTSERLNKGNSQIPLLQPPKTVGFASTIPRADGIFEKVQTFRNAETEKSSNEIIDTVNGPKTKVYNQGENLLACSSRDKRGVSYIAVQLSEEERLALEKRQAEGDREIERVNARMAAEVNKQPQGPQLRSGSKPRFKVATRKK